MLRRSLGYHASADWRLKFLCIANAKHLWAEITVLSPYFSTLLYLSFHSRIVSCSCSLRGRRLKGKGKGVLGARETRGVRKEGAFLSRLKPPFPSLSKACHAGYFLMWSEQIDWVLHFILQDLISVCRELLWKVQIQNSLSQIIKELLENVGVQAV